MREPLYAVESSLRRSYLRAEVLLCIARLGRATAHELTDELNLNPRRISWILHGERPFYAPEKALVPLGLVREVRERGGSWLEATGDGRQIAASIVERRRITAARWAGQMPHLAAPDDASDLPA